MSKEIVVVGLDLAKNVFQVHAIDEQGQPVVRRQLRRACQANRGFDPLGELKN